jgi:hypothetical protein
VVSYQRLYVPETLAGLVTPNAESLDLLDRFGRDHGLRLHRVPDLQPATFKRAQILGFNGQPLLQMTFSDAGGQPVALCVTMTGEADSPPSWQAAEELEVVTWTMGGNRFVLVGTTSRDVLNVVLQEFTAA